MGRLYTAQFDNVTVAAAQDFLNLTATANMAFRVLQVVISQKTLTAWSAVRVYLKRFPATVTAGSGGTAVTLRKINNGDAAATVTSRANDTTPMTTSGTAETLWSDDFMATQGFLWMPPSPEAGFVIAPSQGFAFGTPDTPTSQVCDGTILLEELF